MEYYVVQVSTGKEKKFIDEAERPCDNEDNAYSIIFPQRVLKIRKAGKITEKQLAVFPGYVFIEVNSFSEKMYQRIKNCKGFYRFLPNNREPQTLENNDLEILNKFISFGSLAKISKVSFDENDRIQVIEGPLKGLEGYIIQINKRKGRAKICLDMCNTPFSIDLGFEILEVKDKGKNNDSVSN